VGLAGPGVLVGESDERLVALAQDGDERAFAAIVARYRGPLLRYCLRYLPPESADDALQQTFINAHAALSRERGPVALRPWLYRIAHNAALNVARDPQLGLARVPESLDGRERPEDVVQQRDHLDRVVAAMKALPDNQRDVIVRHELAGDSHERIAKDLGLSAGAVRQLAYRARAAVRAAAAALIPGPVLRMLPWMSGAESAASGPGPALAKAAVVVVIAGAAGGEAVHTLSERAGADRPRARAAAPAPRPAAAAPAVRDSASVSRVPTQRVARPRRSSAARERRPASTRRTRESASAPAETVDDGSEVEQRVDNSGPGSESSGPGSGGSGSSGSNSGPGSGSSGSGSGSSGSNSGPGSGSSGSGSGSSGSGSGSSGSGSGSSGSDSDSSGSGSGSADEPDDDSGDSSGQG
jgi:RNA polymerase sigma factor (sigma-70 family)